MSVALRKLDGVGDARVSLNEGTATIELKPENEVSLGRIRDLVRSNGFTPRSAEVSVEGRLVERAGEVALEVPETGEVYLLRDRERARAHMKRLLKEGPGSSVKLRGRVPERSDGANGEPWVLEVMAVVE